MPASREATVVCVLKTGGEYAAKHVERLRLQVERHAPSAPFVCLTDDLAVNRAYARRLEHGWPGWWSKLEIFRLPGPCLYLDLDVTIIDDLAPLLAVARHTELCVAANFWVRDPHKINSSVMAWSGDAQYLYKTFAEAPEAHMSVYRTPKQWGDQAFIADHAKRFETWQARLPGMVVSFKRGALMGEDLSDMVLCCSHGQPKPWSVGGADEWLAKRGLARKLAPVS